MIYEDAASYLDALQKDPKLAVLPLQMVADLREVSRGAIDQMLRAGRLQEIRIGGTRFVSAASIHALQRSEEDRVNRVEAFLEDLARKRGTVTYEPVMASVGLSWRVPRDRSIIGQILGTISTRTWEEHGILLTTLVHRKMAGRTRPGPGFFQLAEDLGLPEWSDENELIERETKRVWDFYSQEGAK